MKSKSTLSIAPYYGGKGRMAHFIAERLDYSDSDVFVTPFGGMCRVLLNKPRHKLECYNDFDSGLCSLMRILSDPQKAVELIQRLYYKTEYSQGEFDRQKAIYDYAKTDLEEYSRERLRQALIMHGIATPHGAGKLLDKIFSQTMQGEKKPMPAELKNALAKDAAFQTQFTDLLADWLDAYQIKEQAILERTPDIGKYISDMDLAVATYVVFQQSRDGMGQAWSKEKFKTTDQYLKQVLELYECAERLEGVEVFQIDAIDFFREFQFVDVNLPDEEADQGFLRLNEWINNPRVMMYCDPSYISVEDEAKLLEGIDVEQEDSLSEAIERKYAGKMPRNLGKVYARSFGYDDQENFLRCIQKARCRILVSNYDLMLYNKYLNESTGWRREEFITTTGVGGKIDNTRIEVVWYNY